jgi:hypothetical protein
MPKKMEDRVPLASYWAAIKGKNPDLGKNPAFKPDINGPIKTYDAGIANYLKLMQDREKMLDMLPPYDQAMKGFNVRIDNQHKELDKISSEDVEKMDKARAGINAECAKEENADIMNLSGLLVDLSVAMEDAAKSYAQSDAQLDKIKAERVAVTNKLRDDFKAKATTIVNGMKKCEDDTVKLEGQIRGIISAYQKVGTQLEKKDVVSGVRDLLTHF